MNLNQMITEVLEKYAETQPNMASESFRKLLAEEIESEVDKYCREMMECISLGSVNYNF
ncbi:MAG: hypothetical protein ACR2ON_00935 [Paracoccaceae bacterium]